MANFTMNGLLVVGIVSLSLIAQVMGHSYLTNPISRSDQKQSNSGCRGPACLGPCDVPLSSQRTAPVTISRGANILAQWPRNNHAGGFIRFAWAQTAQSDSAASFNSGVQEINCHEVGGCFPDDPSNPNGGDSGPADGSSRACSWNVTVPPHLTDGAWTLQWAWFGGAFALGDYYSCVDYTISGGATGSKPTAVFNGGDYTYPGQPKCKFFNTDRLGQCVDEPCNDPIYPSSQEESGPAFGLPLGGGGSGSVSTTTTTTTGPLTTHSVPSPLTTHAASPLTTHAASPLTTHAPSPMTTHAAAPSSLTTTTPAPLTTNSHPSPPPPLSLTTGVVSAPSGTTQNCANAVTLSSSTVTIAAVDQWSDVFQMSINLHVHEAVLNNWAIEVIWPANAVNTQISVVYNGGKIDCQSTSPLNHAIIIPVASWANKLPSGYVLPIEIQATNTNMNNQFISANTQFRVYKQ